MTDLGGGRLARIDQRIFAALERGDGVRVVKVPVSLTVWSTWRRYCEAMDLTVGEAVARLIVAELETVIDDTGVTAGEVAAELADKAAERAARLDARDEELKARARRLKWKEDHLSSWGPVRHSAPATTTHARYAVKVGRNERCPCGSGDKFKYCHGRTGLPR